LVLFYMWHERSDRAHTESLATESGGHLEGREKGHRAIRQRARRDWASLTSCPFDFELRDAIADALNNERLKGKKHDMDEPGKTYAFIFYYLNLAVYAKINLTAPEEFVIVYSAHRPLYGEELL
jgi:hypothetical protein